MKNIKEKIYAGLQLTMNIFFGLAVLIGWYFCIIWIALRFDPHFIQIDDCLDRGGAWDEQKFQCEYFEYVESNK